MERGARTWRLLRNLTASDLHGVIFPCPERGMRELFLEKKIFGATALHYCYIKFLVEGVSVFLFEESNRQLYGPFETASCGGMNIDPDAFKSLELKKPYPAQVRVATSEGYEPVALTEDEFKPLITGNYYDRKGKFYYELDQVQVEDLLRRFSQKTKEMLEAATNKEKKSEPLSQVQGATRDASTEKAKAETIEESVKGMKRKSDVVPVSTKKSKIEPNAVSQRVEAERVATDEEPVKGTKSETAVEPEKSEQGADVDITDISRRMGTTCTIL